MMCLRDSGQMAVVEDQTVMGAKGYKELRPFNNLRLLPESK